MTATILSVLAFLALTALFAWWVDRQTVDEEHVDQWHVHAEPLYDWYVRCPEWRPAHGVTLEEWDAMVLAMARQIGGVA